MTPIEKYMEWLTSEALSYKQMRDGWKEHSPNWEIYDLMVRQLAKELDKLESILPAEREAIESAYDDGYSLAMQEVGEKDQEIERLGNLIKIAFKTDNINSKDPEAFGDSWQQFKTKHNI